jgi:hypothetical protein
MLGEMSESPRVAAQIASPSGSGPASFSRKPVRNRGQGVSRNAVAAAAHTDGEAEALRDFNGAANIVAAGAGDGQGRAAVQKAIEGQPRLVVTVLTRQRHRTFDGFPKPTGLRGHQAMINRIHAHT